MERPADKPTLLERLSALLTHEPEDREELLDLMRGAFERRLLDADALSMIEGVLSVSETTVRDIMIPRAQMDCVSIDDAPPDFIPLVLETHHSRFPVIGESKDDVIGILLAKELLNYYANPEGFDLKETLRPAVFIPESKRLNVLLREFRANRNHIAIVVDEYGGVSGLVTIEDVLEQIVGDIEDEYDFDESEDNIIPEANGRFRVKAQTEIADFNAQFGTDFEAEEFHTVGGLLLKAFGRLPKRGETTTLEGFRFRVLRADSRRSAASISRRSRSRFALRCCGLRSTHCPAVGGGRSSCACSQDAGSRRLERDSLRSNGPTTTEHRSPFRSYKATSRRNSSSRRSSATRRTRCTRSSSTKARASSSCCRKARFPPSPIRSPTKSSRDC